MVPNVNYTAHHGFFVHIQESNNAAIEALAARGAKIAGVDYDSVSNLALALTNVDVVVSALGYAAIFAQQLNLASASKLANVKLFVSSQYGLPDRTGIPSEEALRDKLEDVALSSFFVGVFTDSLFKYAYVSCYPTVAMSKSEWCAYTCILHPCRAFAGLILERGEAMVPGDGTPAISFTDRRDVGRYVAYVLTTLRPSNLVNRQFRIEGQRAVCPFLVHNASRGTVEADFSNSLWTQSLTNTRRSQERQ